MAELWQAIGNFETILRVISVFVVVAGLLGMLTTLLSTLNERRREMAILRAVGLILGMSSFLFVLESLILVILGCLVGMLLLTVLVTLSKQWVIDQYGLFLNSWIPSVNDLLLIVAVSVLAILFSFIPAVIVIDVRFRWLAVRVYAFYKNQNEKNQFTTIHRSFCFISACIAQNNRLKQCRLRKTR